MKMTGTLPSNEFLVGQATLTVLHRTYPFTIALDGRRAVATRLWGLVHDEFCEGREFCEMVQAEYRTLLAKHAAYQPIGSGQ